jgi:hypothetical protein
VERNSRMGILSINSDLETHSMKNTFRIWKRGAQNTSDPQMTICNVIENLYCYNNTGEMIVVISKEYLRWSGLCLMVSVVR